MKNKGFTLVEMLIAIAVFSIVILISVGALLNLARANNRSHAVLVAINNLDFAMEQMGRTIRVGTNYFCSNGNHPVTEQVKDCVWPASRSALSLTDQYDDRILYIFNKGNNSLDRVDLNIIPRRTFSITSPEIIIEKVNFTVVGTDKSDNIQPRVMLNISGRTNIGGTKPEDQVSFDLQTLVSQRNPDF